MRSLFVGVFAVHLLVVLAVVVVGPWLVLRERGRRRSADAPRGPQA